MSSTTPYYVHFSFNYIDSPNFLETIEQIRAGSLDPRDVDWDHVIGDRRQPEVSAETTDDTSGTFLSGISLALFIPLLIVCIFLLVFGICFLRHSLSKRCRRIDGASFNSMFRGVATPYGGGSGDRSRNSTRSTNPLQRSIDERLSGRSTVSTVSNAAMTSSSKATPPVLVTKVTRLGSIRESPEDYYKKSIRESPDDYYKKYMNTMNNQRSVSTSIDGRGGGGGFMNKFNRTGSFGGTITPDSQSSMSSVFSRMTRSDYGGGAGNILSNSAMYPLSDKTLDTPIPIPIISPAADKPASAQSFPNLILSTHDSIIPYRLTWITPLSAQSEPVVNQQAAGGSNLERKLFAQLEKRTEHATVNVLSASQTSGVAHNASKLSDKSPFHPNNNTPTNGSDADNLPEDVFINHTTHSFIAPNNESGMFAGNLSAGTPLLNALGSSLVRRQIQSVGSNASTLDRSQRSSRGGNGSLSGMGGIATWHHNDIYRSDKTTTPQYLIKNGQLQGAIHSFSNSNTASPSNGGSSVKAFSGRNSGVHSNKMTHISDEVNKGHDHAGVNIKGQHQGGQGQPYQGQGQYQGQHPIEGQHREDVSMCANIGSSNTSMSHQNSENQLRSIAGNAMVAPSNGSGSGVAAGNTSSVCAHAGSNETTQTCDSSLTTIGCDGGDDGHEQGHGQGHSTSIEHVGNSTAMTDAGSYYGMGGNPGYSIHALSAIQSNSLVSEGVTMQSLTGSEVNSEVVMSSGHMVSEGTQTGSHLISGISSEAPTDDLPSFASTTRSAPAILSRPPPNLTQRIRTDTPYVPVPPGGKGGAGGGELVLQPSALANIPEQEGDDNSAGPTDGGTDQSYMSPIAVVSSSSGSGTERTVPTPASGRSLDWDGFPFYFFVDETDENRRGSAGTVRNVLIQSNATSGVAAGNRRSSASGGQAEVIKDANTGHYLAVTQQQQQQQQGINNMTFNPTSSDESGSSAPVPLQYLGVDVYREGGGYEGVGYGGGGVEGVDEEEERRRSGGVVVGESTRRRSGQPLLDEKQYWV